MPSYLRLLTEQPAHIGTPPTGHTALYASSGTGGEHKYELYIKNPEGFSHPVGIFASGGTVSGNATFNSGVTVYSGGYTMSGAGDAAFAALVVNGTISGLTSPGNNPAGGGVIIQDCLTVSGNSAGAAGGGVISGTTKIGIGDGHTIGGFYSSAFGKGHNVSGLVGSAFGSANTVTNSTGAFAFGKVLTSTGLYSFAAGSANTVSGNLAVGFGGGNNVTGQMSAAFGTGNTSSSDASFAMGTGTTASALASFAAGSATTASGTSHFVVGRGNISSNLFVVGNGTGTVGGGFASLNNAFTVRHSGVTILSSGRTHTGVDNDRNGLAALSIYSGAGHNAMGFMLPLVEENFIYSGSGVWPPSLSATTHVAGSKGMMFWDGNNVRVWTGGTKWAKMGLVDDGYIAMTGH